MVLVATVTDPATLLSPNSFPLIHLIIYLDRYDTSMVTSYLIVSYHARRFVPPSPRDLSGRPRPRPCRGVGACPELLGASDCSFSFVFFNVQPSNRQTFKRFRRNSFICHPSQISPRNPIHCHTSETA